MDAIVSDLKKIAAGTSSCTLAEIAAKVEAGRICLRMITDDLERKLAILEPEIEQTMRRLSLQAEDPTELERIVRSEDLGPDEIDDFLRSSPKINREQLYAMREGLMHVGAIRGRIGLYNVTIEQMGR